MVNLEQNEQHTIQPNFTAQQYLLICIVGIVLSMLTGMLTLSVAMTYEEEQFHAKADLVYDELTRRYSTLEAVLTALAGFHQASDSVSEVQFSTFAQELLSAYPYIRSAVSLHRLDNASRADFEEEMLEHGYYQFNVTESTENGRLIPAAPRPIYLIINIIEPLLPHMGSLLGYDVLSDTGLSDAVYEAMVSGKGIASPATTLLNNDGGIMVFKAVYQGRYAPKNENERLDMFNGAIAMEVGAQSLLSDLAPSTSQLNIRINQLNSSSDSKFEYSVTTEKDTHGRISIIPPLTYRRDLNLYGQATQLSITQPLRLADLHYGWPLMAIISFVIIYIAMISSWRNMKITRLHEKELEGFAARAAFSEENTDPIMRIDHDGKLLYSNDPGRIIMNDWNTEIGALVPDNIKAFVLEVLKQKQYKEIEVTIDSTHFTLRFVLCGARNYVNVYGRHDTEQKQAELNLLEAKKAAEAANIAKSRFLATISHEVRTPMNGVLGMLELLLGTQLSNKQAGFAESAIRCGKSLLTLINDILDFSKIESSKLVLHNVAFSLEDTINDVVQIVFDEARRKNLNLTSDIPAIDYQLIGDEQRLRQILINLAGNAVKFTEKGDVHIHVEITAEYENSIELKIEIRDTGIGIKPEALSYIFDDFTQQDDSTTRKFGGTGLGLAITKQLINMMGGEIYVESTQDEGSCFWITLELKKQILESSNIEYLQHSTELEKDVDDKLVLNASILLAEDNIINQEVATAMLESTGCKVTVVEDGELALQALQDSHYDLVLMDCQMPGMDGFEATRILRLQQSQNSQIPVIAITADIQQGIIEQCHKAGMNDYLSKPFTHDSLIEVITKWLPEKACCNAWPAA